MSRRLIADTSTPIFVLRVKPDPVHHGGLLVARSAGRLGIAVHAVHAERVAPTALSRYVRSNLIIRREASADEWVENLLRVGRRLGRAMLVPIDDPGTVLVDDHADALAERFIFPRRPPGLSRLLGSKRELHLLCERLRIPSPRAAFPSSAAEAAELAAGVGYPVVAKRIVAWAPPADPAAESVCIAHGREDLLAAYRRMESPAEANVMLQEHIPGAPTSVWMFNGYFDERSEALVGFTGRKLRQHPPYTGATTLGLCAANERVDRDARRLLREVGYRGIVDLGFRYDERDGSYKLLDVNPRIGATFRLFACDGGLDVLRAQYLHLTGQPVPPAVAREGRRWLVEPLDVRSSLRYWRDGLLTPGAWLRSYAGVEEAAWVAADDPLPAVAVALRLASDSARRRAPRAIARRRR
jgi:D-aspartate ligase